MRQMKIVIKASSEKKSEKPNQNVRGAFLLLVKNVCTRLTRRAAHWVVVMHWRLRTAAYREERYQGHLVSFELCRSRETGLSHEWNLECDAHRIFWINVVMNPVRVSFTMRGNTPKHCVVHTPPRQLYGCLKRRFVVVVARIGMFATGLPPLEQVCVVSTARVIRSCRVPSFGHSMSRRLLRHWRPS